MRRREFLGVLGGAAAAWPFAARAQQQMPVIGFLSSSSPDLWVSRVQAFRQGLSEAGYDVGRNVAIEYRWGEGQYDRLPAMASDLVLQRVAVLVANGPGALAAKTATTTIPIVFLTGYDPVQFGLVSSLNRPGSNLTGVSNLNAELGPKRLELLRELIPAASLMCLLVNPSNSNAEPQAKDLQAAARSLGLQLDVLHASAERDFEPALATLRQMRASALVFATDGFFISRSEHLGALTARHGLPAIFQNREFATAGGLMGYGGSDIDANRMMGIYAGRILKGEKPADLPVQQATKAELIINLKTAKALGIPMPPSLLARADEVIE